jgi:hypothetical protein
MAASSSLEVLQRLLEPKAARTLRIDQTIASIRGFALGSGIRQALNPVLRL